MFLDSSVVMPDLTLSGSDIIFVVLLIQRSHTMTSATRFLTKLLTEDLPRLFVRPKKIVLDFEKGRAMGPVAGDVASDIIQNVASGIMQGVASDLVQDVQDGNKDFVGELSVTLVDARKLSFVLFGKDSLLSLVSDLASVLFSLELTSNSFLYTQWCTTLLCRARKCSNKFPHLEYDRPWQHLSRV